MRKIPYFPSLVCLLLLLSSCSTSSAFSTDAPLQRAGQRPVALRFGMHVTPDPKTNPIDPPERFEGYHAALDFETFAEELESDVPVYAICDGEVYFSGFAAGYGGLLVQRCTISGESVTVIYGHLDGGDELVKKGTVLYAGDPLGKLADPHSHWSDGNRKHLHLGIHRGDKIDERGYVQAEAELAEFLDPATVLPFGATGKVVEKFHVPIMK